MPDFKKMYFKLAGSYVDAIEFMNNQSEIMKTVLQDMEEYYSSCEDKAPILLDKPDMSDSDIDMNNQISDCELKRQYISEI